MSSLSSSGFSRKTHSFEVHGEINTIETIRMAYDRSKELNINKIVVASETGLSALKVLEVFNDSKVVVVSSAYGTFVENSPVGDLRLGITDEKISNELKSKGARAANYTPIRSTLQL